MIRLGRVLCLAGALAAGSAINAAHADPLGARQIAELPPGSAIKFLTDLHRLDGIGPWSTGTGNDPLCGCAVDPGTMRIADPYNCPAFQAAELDDDAVLDSLPLINVGPVAQRLTCGRAGSSFCRDPQTGLRLTGAECCKGDLTFRRAVEDPHLSVVAPRLVIRQLAGFRPGLPGTRGSRPMACGMTVDDGAGTYHFPRYMDGFVARAMVHAHLGHGLPAVVTPGAMGRLSAANPPVPYEINLSAAGYEIYRIPNLGLRFGQ